jgi:nicotinamide-nucleotide amidase
MTPESVHDVDPVVAAMIEDPHPSGTRGLAEQVVAGLIESGWSIATAESLTGGGICAALTDVPGASRCVAGGVVSYATSVKESVLGVDAQLLRRRGAVDAEVAQGMAHGVARLLGVDCAIATTGSAGPDWAPGGEEAEPVPPGTVFIAVMTPSASWVEQMVLSGDRDRIRTDSIAAALRICLRALRD